jgi:chitin synthase
MYLAEDRIMCLGIHALGYDLAYLPDAESCVDPVTSLTRLLGQRRRWMNGSWFAFNYVREHSYESSSWLFYMQLLYYSFVQKLQWVQISIFYIAMNLTLIATTR